MPHTTITAEGRRGTPTCSCGWSAATQPDLVTAERVAWHHLASHLQPRPFHDERLALAAMGMPALADDDPEDTP